jgi:hypothetical protein
MFSSNAFAETANPLRASALSNRSIVRSSVLALTEDSQIVETVRVCADEDAGMHLAVS